MATERKRKPGRPAAKEAKTLVLCFRVTPAMWAALEKYRDGLGVEELSVQHAARDYMGKAMRAEGLLK